MSRKQLPVRRESRKKSALERRVRDLAMHIASDNKDKGMKALADVENLRKKLGITS